MRNESHINFKIPPELQNYTQYIHFTTKLNYNTFSSMSIDSFKSSSKNAKNFIEFNSSCSGFYKFRKSNLLQKNKKIHICFVSQFTVYPVDKFLTYLLELELYDVEIFKLEYGQHMSFLLDEQNKNKTFDFLIYFANVENIEIDVRDNFKTLEEKCSASIEQQTTFINSFCEKFKANAIVANLCAPYNSQFGDLRARLPASDLNLTLETNRQLAIQLNSAHEFLDLFTDSALFGSAISHDKRFFYMSDNIFSPDFCVHISKQLFDKIDKYKIAAKKCLVLDLDNTLWGGVIGDDGIDGIQLGSNSPAGKAFHAFQCAIKKMNSTGILLAICSKNNIEVALDAINNHPEMPLREKDFVQIKANWNPKPDNIRDIALSLNIGLDSLVFIDDNPMEIDIVKKSLPEVECVLLSNEPSEYVETLYSLKFFNKKSLTQEDFSKNEQYQSEGKRNSLANQFTDLKSYLKSLEMNLKFSNFNATNLSRVEQLVNKSNQFNLTTLRRTETELLEISKNPNYIGFTVNVEDKFGDYGLISVIILELDKNTKSAKIDTWLMSCRVLKRGVELEVFNQVISTLKRMNYKTLTGQYIRTAKNSIVEQLLPEFGMENSDTPNHYTINCDTAKIHETFFALPNGGLNEYI